jgi:lipopolysaccharide export system permease protein
MTTAAGRLLDRYVLTSWIRLFVLTALGFPFVAVLISMIDELNKLLDRGLSVGQIIVSYLYALPENISQVMPAAVLVATVFTVGGMGRHSEVTAAKASGRSFHRLVQPIFVAGAIASILALLIGELAVGATAHQKVLQRDREAQPTAGRFNFVYRGDAGWVYAIRALDVPNQRLKDVVLERAGRGLSYPTIVVSADSAGYSDSLRGWQLWHGAARLVADANHQATFRFTSARLRALTQNPVELVAPPKAPDEMRYAELGLYIDALKRSGNDTNKLEVDRALKLAIPMTCLIVALLGAPLALTTPRSGAAAGIGLSLATTIVFLLLTQLARAVGSGGVVNPVVAAWLPNAIFLLAALVLLDRVRT